MGARDIDAVCKLPGVVTVLDVENDRVVEYRGVDDPDNLEIVLHFAGTWWELLGALLPVLGDALDRAWTPGRWWACAGGVHVALGRDGRALLVDAVAAAPSLRPVRRRHGRRHPGLGPGGSRRRVFPGTARFPGNRSGRSRRCSLGHRTSACRWRHGTGRVHSTGRTFIQ